MSEEKATAVIVAARNLLIAAEIINMESGYPNGITDAEWADLAMGTYALRSALDELNKEEK